MSKSLKITERGVVYQKTTLPSGIRVISELVPSVRSVSLGVWVNTGSRNESPEENGLSHFVEHLVFKGTKTRNAKQIGASLEQFGGHLNAFTTREHTCYTARVLDEYLGDAVDILADITCHATLNRRNMDRERLVITEEIKESLDTPSDFIHDMFSEGFWGRNPIGQPIMGSAENIMSVKRALLTNYMKRQYRAESVVVAASGAVPHRRLVQLVKDKLELDEGKGVDAVPAARNGFKRVNVKSLQNAQTHLCLGFPGLSFGDLRKMAALVMTSYLGGGMSSVLFQKVREQRGLAYSVYAFHDFFADSGVLGIYMGTDHNRLEEAYEVVMKELRRLKQRKLSSDQVDRVKDQLKGNLLLGLESTSHRMHRLGRQELVTGQYLTIGNTTRRIDRVTPSDILELANELIDEDQLSVSVLGPVKKAEVGAIVGGA